MKRLYFLLLLSTAALADNDTWLNVHGASIHTKDAVTVEGTEYTINGFNPGIGWEAPLENGVDTREYNSYRVGFYKNSYSATSVYAVLDLHTKNTNGPGAGVFAGIVTGYDIMQNDRKFTGALVPYVKYIYNGYKAEMTFNYGAHTSSLGFSVGVAY